MRPLVALLLLLLLTPALQAAPSATALARLAPSTGDVVGPLTAGLQSPDVLTRATAARVAAVRGEGALLPALREALTNENNPHAARGGNRPPGLAGPGDDPGLAGKRP